MADSPITGPGTFWMLLGIVGGLIFYGRFYVQWIASEMKGRSVMPVIFWYMSSAGSLMLLAFAVVTQSPVGALGQSLNTGIYSRNLIHIWRERGRLTPTLYWVVHISVALILVVAIGLVGLTWLREYRITQDAPRDHVIQTWFWLGVGLAGQALFAGRFIVQWVATEMQRKSVIPKAFWHLSTAAALLQMACFFQRQEWVFAIGMLATVFIYVRNLYLIRKGNEENTVS